MPLKRNHLIEARRKDKNELKKALVNCYRFVQSRNEILFKKKNLKYE